MAADLNRLRNDLISMLLSDRQSALRQKNASAAITASSKIADLLLGKLAAEEASTKQPITQLTHVIVHQVVCPRCRERTAVSTAPPKDAPVTPPEHWVSAWDEPDLAASDRDEAGKPLRCQGTLLVPRVVPPKRDAKIKGLV